MSMGPMPAYSYRPAVSGDPSMRTRSTRRGRLFEGGTYFRAREPGAHGNLISIEMQEWETNGERKAKLVVTNHKTLFAENIIGPVNIEVFTQELNWNERYLIQTINGELRAHKYSISLQIAEGMTLVEDLGLFTFNTLFHIPSKLSVKLTQKSSEYTPASIITIKPRTRVYDLVIGPPIPPTDPTVAPLPPSWDIQQLREQINANDPWIEMLPRSGEAPPVEGVAPAPPIVYDVQDKGIDKPYLLPFPDTYLSGADGLPDSPSGERTGPTRSLIHINYGERPNGSLAEVNTVYEWVGEASTSGIWKSY